MLNWPNRLRRCRPGFFLIVFSLFYSSIAAAQKNPFPDLRIVKKPGQQTGSAMVTINGKNKVLAHHALQAWPVMDNENALVLVEANKKPSGKEFRVRFYEGLTRKYRAVYPRRPLSRQPDLYGHLRRVLAQELLCQER